MEPVALLLIYSFRHIQDDAQNIKRTGKPKIYIFVQNVLFLNGVLIATFLQMWPYAFTTITRLRCLVLFCFLTAAKWKEQKSKTYFSVISVRLASVFCSVHYVGSFTMWRLSHTDIYQVTAENKRRRGYCYLWTYVYFRIYILVLQLSEYY